MANFAPTLSGAPPISVIAEVSRFISWWSIEIPSSPISSRLDRKKYVDLNRPSCALEIGYLEFTFEEELDEESLIVDFQDYLHEVLDWVLGHNEEVYEKLHFSTRFLHADGFKKGVAS
ncbi:hypothetical protein NL676_022908 [Syzygium grande]|nr:hypothetical protein NL676_022908 [Syzygium grande]